MSPSLLFMLGMIICAGLILKQRINTELSWISRSILEPKELDQVKGQARFYHFICWAISEGLIQKGMAKKEIIERIDGYIKQNKSIKSDYEWLEWRKNLWFNGPKENYKIMILGYGMDIPTPKLILVMQKGKLVRWNGLSAEQKMMAKNMNKKSSATLRSLGD